jgi:hypothetical protein
MGGGGGGNLFSPLLFVLGPFMPLLLKLPSAQGTAMRAMAKSLGVVAQDLLAKQRTAGEKDVDRSIIGLLSEFSPWPLFS